MKISTSSLLKTGGKISASRAALERKWDVAIVGAGHNGLVAAFYLARAGKRVLVLEAREKVGGACTLEETWPGFKVSPCAYVVGLLHGSVSEDLRLKQRGFTWTPATGGMFVPFEDGTSLQLHYDDEKCAAEVRHFAPKDYEGWRAMGKLKARARELLRPDDEKDIWLCDPPSRQEVEARLGHDPTLIKLLFEWSMAELVEHFIQDEKFQCAYLGQGVIGTFRSPFDKGTASVHFHHISGHMDHLAGTWGYVHGGMGLLSFYLGDAALEAGATIHCGAKVARIVPEQGVELEDGRKISADTIMGNADPRTVLRLLENEVPSGLRKKVERIPSTGCTVKVNWALKSLPDFKARPGKNEDHHRSQINTPLTKDEWKTSFAAAKRGEISKRIWTENYFQSVFDSSVVPKGFHTMSTFAQYVPHTFAEGNWDLRRQEVLNVITDSIGRFCTGFSEGVLAQEVLGPPDLEKKVGLSGGHIFQGEILPEFMWDQRLPYRTEIPGVYLCGAGTYPGGSVMGINGRNAAMALLKDEKASAT